MLSLRFCTRLIRALSSAASGKPQFDNSIDFLSNVPHRKHPGILHLNIVRLPQEAEDAAKYILKKCHIQGMEEHAAALSNYLWSRKRPIEDTELRIKASAIEDEFKARLPDSEENTPAYKGKIKSQVLNALRKQTYNWQPLSYTEQTATVYLAARFDGGYAAVTRALQEIRQRVPDFTPQTLLDFGSGVGSVSWAAHSIWGTSLKEYMCVDSSESMNQLNELILRGGEETGDIGGQVQYDLVISAFSLNELPNLSARQMNIRALWRKTGGFLVLVENGTREGHQLLMEARETILRVSDKEIWDHRPACIFAPCPHQLECPRLAESSKLPCNFVQQYHSLPLRWHPPHRWEKFSFLVFSRGTVSENGNQWPRVIGPVLSRPRHVHCHTCGADGKLHHDVITPQRHGRDLYRCARNCEWGDRLPALISHSTDPDTCENEKTNDS
ncbi:PREDICTED: methyltransferase-like protein 17, mitochondrial [Nanorana parkeri]|uniref:methyltransferase-like protein 17, mitochondrial n=1 Tax=Nanorana parkeri TaxID=125878 RepID=UPI0008549E56|nr:PREDICTED: methyltransferase-like protein 17, mitochondrial [Nanorana parkeri]